MLFVNTGKAAEWRDAGREQADCVHECRKPGRDEAEWKNPDGKEGIRGEKNEKNRDGSRKGMKEADAMTMTKKKDGTTLTITVEGKLDATTSPEVAAGLEQDLDGVEKLFWDFEKLDYISSAGFRVLLIAENMLEDPDQMKVLHANELVQAAFILTGQGSMLLED